MKVHGIDATYYTARDLPRLTTFYAELLGASPEIQVPGRIAEWSFGDGSSFGLYGMESASGNGGSVMFAVGNVAEAVREAAGRGVKFHEGGEVTDTPECHMAFGEDPEGNQFILHARKRG